MTSFHTNNIESALVLCKCIEEWQSCSTNNAELSDYKKFDWSTISTIAAKYDLRLTPLECCKIWKFVAYGKLLKDEDVLEVLSDDDDAYFQPLSALKRYKSGAPQRSWSEPNDTEVSLFSVNLPGPNLSTVRQQFKKVKFLVPEQIHTGTSSLHPQVYNSEKSFHPVYELTPLPAPITSIVMQANPRYQELKANKLFLRGHVNIAKLNQKPNVQPNVQPVNPSAPATHKPAPAMYRPQTQQTQQQTQQQMPQQAQPPVIVHRPMQPSTATTGNELMRQQQQQMLMHQKVQQYKQQQMQQAQLKLAQHTQSAQHTNPSVPLHQSSVVGNKPSAQQQQQSLAPSVHQLQERQRLNLLHLQQQQILNAKQQQKPLSAYRRKKLEQEQLLLKEKLLRQQQQPQQQQQLSGSSSNSSVSSAYKTLQTPNVNNLNANVHFSNPTYLPTQQPRGTAPFQSQPLQIPGTSSGAQVLVTAAGPATTHQLPVQLPTPLSFMMPTVPDLAAAETQIAASGGGFGSAPAHHQQQQQQDNKRKLEEYMNQ